MASRSTLPLAEGTPLGLSSARDVETLVRAHGTRFVVTDRNGDVAPPGARELGLFCDDTRFLSHYQLTLPDLELVHLSSSSADPACNRVDLTVGCVSSEELDEPPNFLHVRRRQIINDVFRDELEIVNHLHRRIDVDVVLSFAADFADVFELRGARRTSRGTLMPPSVTETSVDLRYKGLDAKTYTTRLAFTPAPQTLTSDTATYRFSIEPGRSAVIDVCIAPAVTASGHRAATDFEARLHAEREALAKYAEACTRVRCDNRALQEVLDQSAQDLRALSIGMCGQRILAAGVPWSGCPFGRDAMVASYEALMLDPTIAADTLRTLAAFQGKTFDDFTEEEPGKIFHELRFGEMAATREIPHRPYFGTIDATPLFVIVAHATFKATGDAVWLTELKGAITSALAWIDDRSEDGARLVTYRKKSPRGLENQGWKDSRAAVSHPDGRRAEPPIALAEVQGYCVDAYRRGAELLRAVGESESADLYAGRAKQMARVADQALWLPERGRYAFAIDGAGSTIATVVSNIGHLLWSKLPPPERALASTELLVGRESLSRFGIRTVAEGQAVFNPLSYHNGSVWPHDNAIIAKGIASYGFMGPARAIADALIAAMPRLADRRLPELYCGSTDDVLVRYPGACAPHAAAAAAPFLLLQALLGIHMDAPCQRLLIRNPTLPTSVDRIELEGLRVGGSRVTLRFLRVDGRCHVDRVEVTGAPLRTFVELD